MTDYINATDTEMAIGAVGLYIFLLVLLIFSGLAAACKAARRAIIGRREH
jgi:hypothetical protein